MHMSKGLGKCVGVGKEEEGKGKDGEEVKRRKKRREERETIFRVGKRREAGREESHKV